MPFAFHAVLSTYGFWLPNDPRGSWSEFIGGQNLRAFGPATKVQTHRSVAAAPHNRQQRLRAKVALAHPPVSLTGTQALAIAQGFDRARRESNYTLHACAILPDHAHLVIAAASHSITYVIGHLKRRATQSLTSQNLWPPGRPLWADGLWRVFLFTPHDIVRSIKYVESNPLKEGKPAQRWSFVTPYPPRLAGRPRRPNRGERSPGATG